MGRILPILIGTITGLVLIGMIASNLTVRRAAVPPTPDQAYPGGIPLGINEAIVALQPIPRGSEFFPGSIGRRELPGHHLPASTIDDEAETIGKVARTDIVQGQIIVREMLDERLPAEQQVVENVVTVEVEKEVEAEEVRTVAVENVDQADRERSAFSAAAQAQENRVIIYTGQIWLVVKNTEEAVVTITGLVKEVGGYVSETMIYQASNNVSQGRITVRVPWDQYEVTMAELRALALQVQREESRSQDVTAEFIDQEARLANLQAGEEALLQLLAEQQEGNIADIATVQQKLAEVRGQIEQSEGRLRYLSDQAFLSTITIELIPETLPPTPTPIPTPLPGWTPGNVAQEASQSLLFSFQRTVDAAIWGIIFIPLILLYLIPILVIVWLIRRGWKRYRAPGKGLT